MAKTKRSAISDSRAKRLRASDVYVICCGVEGCTCGLENGRCERGFFSLFLQAIYGIDFAERNGIPYHIGFNNCLYCYSEKENDNIWNYYFEQPIRVIPSHYASAINLFHEIYPLRIWDRNHLRKMNRHVSLLKFHDSIHARVRSAKQAVIQGKTLGVHVRRTDHPVEVAAVPLKSFFRTVDKHIAQYDSLFLSTDDTGVVDSFRDRYGDKVRINSATRSDDAVAVHRDFRRTTRRELGLEVITDCLCLAACDRIIITCSNVSYAALLFNPDIAYTLLERPYTAWRRYKTLIVYFLDKWGIRRW